MAKNKQPKRAIALGGGGPVAGLHLGALKYLCKECEMDFRVWALSCIGAWVGVVYNQATPGSEFEETREFFRKVFREDHSFAGFPVNSVFGPDWLGCLQAYTKFALDPQSYRNSFLPCSDYLDSIRATGDLLADFSRGNLNAWIHNQVMAKNPYVRFWTSMMFLSQVNGLARMHYPNSNFLQSIDFARLNHKDKPFLFYNAYNLDQQKLDLFANHIEHAAYPKVTSKDYLPISDASLCACSALPFVEETVEVNNQTYCEGALIDTLNFKSILKHHHNPPYDRLDEIWVCRIVDADQIRKPNNLHDSMANLCQLFAATVGEDDVKLFRFHAKKEKWEGDIIEIEVSSKVTFEWTHENLEKGIEEGYLAAKKAHAKHVSDRGSAPV